MIMLILKIECFLLVLAMPIFFFYAFHEEVEEEFRKLVKKGKKWINSG